MPLTTPNASEVLMLRYITNDITPDNPKLHLYTNDVSIDEDTVLGDFTESLAAGYAASDLTSWTIATVAGVSTAEHSEVIYTLTAAETCKGYYVSNAASTTLLWAEALGEDYVIPSGGGQIKVTAKLTLE